MSKYNLDLNNLGDITEFALNESESLTMENPEHDILIAEQLLFENLSNEELDKFFNEGVEYQKACLDGILNEKTIIKFDKKAKLSRAEAQAVFAVAREKSDRDFKKLVTIWKMRRVLIDKLTKKYGNEAKRRAKKSVQSMNRSTSNVMKTVAKKIK